MAQKRILNCRQRLVEPVNHHPRILQRRGDVHAAGDGVDGRCAGDPCISWRACRRINRVVDRLRIGGGGLRRELVRVYLRDGGGWRGVSEKS